MQDGKYLSLTEDEEPAILSPSMLYWEPQSHFVVRSQRDPVSYRDLRDGCVFGFVPDEGTGHSLGAGGGAADRSAAPGAGARGTGAGGRAGAGMVLGILGKAGVVEYRVRGDARDPVVLAGVVVAMALLGLVATWVPA